MFLSLKKRTTHIKIVMKKITRSQDNSMMRKATLELFVIEHDKEEMDNNKYHGTYNYTAYNYLFNKLKNDIYIRS